MISYDLVPRPTSLAPVLNSGWPIGVTREFSEAIDLYDPLMAQINLARPASTQEIANGALILAAPANFYNAGHVLPIDGGWMAGFARGY